MEANSQTHYWIFAI